MTMTNRWERMMTATAVTADRWLRFRPDGYAPSGRCPFFQIFLETNSSGSFFSYYPQITLSNDLWVRMPSHLMTTLDGLLCLLEPDQPVIVTLDWYHDQPELTFVREPPALFDDDVSEAALLDFVEASAPMGRGILLLGRGLLADLLPLARTTMLLACDGRVRI